MLNFGKSYISVAVGSLPDTTRVNNTQTSHLQKKKVHISSVFDTIECQFKMFQAKIRGNKIYVDWLRETDLGGHPV